MIKCLETMPHEKRLKEWGLFPLESEDGVGQGTISLLT